VDSRAEEAGVRAEPARHGLGRRSPREDRVPESRYSYAEAAVLRLVNAA